MLLETIHPTCPSSKNFFLEEHNSRTQEEEEEINIIAVDSELKQD